LIEAGADVNAQRAEGKGPTEGNTPLYYAVDSNATVAATVALLINAGADVDLTCKSNDSSLITPLSVAVDDAKVIMVTLLIHAGADVNKADKDGQTPLTLAEKRDTLIKSRRKKRRELMERNPNYRNALRCDPKFFPGREMYTPIDCTPLHAIETLERCSDAILDMLRNAEYMRAESKK
jgi:ankyrin repeat protein